MATNKAFLAACRTVHIYLTLLGLLVMLLFAVTGVTLNHADWFGAITPQVVERKEQLPAALIAARDPLRIVEQVRTTFGIHGALVDFAEAPDEIALAFKEPGQTWDVAIDRATSKATARNELLNSVALLNNLHRGRYSGPAWSWVIDLSALLIVLACATGVVLWLALPKRQRLGIAFLALGTVATIVMAYFFVPGPDVTVEAKGATPATMPKDGKNQDEFRSQEARK